MKIASYRITYKNGATQVLDLIPHSDYTNIIKPAKLEISDLKEIKRMSTEQFNRLNYLNEIIDSYGTQFFTDESPLGLAINDGILRLSKIQGGDHKVKFELI